MVASLVIAVSILALLLYIWAIMDIFFTNRKRPSHFFNFYWLIGFPIFGPLVYFGIKQKFKKGYSRSFNPWQRKASG